MSESPRPSPTAAPEESSRLGDIPVETLRSALHQAADEIADYLAGVERRPVVPAVLPGEVGATLPAAPPDVAEPIDRLLDDYRRLIVPATTHWNHPGFLAYFSSSGSGPGILGETLAAGLSVNGMLWRTSPAAVELEMRVCDWLRQMIGLPEDFAGHINDTASMSTFLSLAVARDRDPELAIGQRGMAGREDLPPLVVYASEQAHSSVDKAMIGLGLGSASLRRLPTEDDFRLDIAALETAIVEDRRAGRRPIAVVATAGTTSTTSVDPIAEIADVCARHALWLHVDAAWAGSAAICPEYRPHFAGIERADSVVINPHKWLFVPMDCSVLFVRDLEQLRRTFSLVPEYLRTDSGAEAVDLMDYGIQLGRRFRALKLWFVIRAFGVEGLRARIREHCRLGQVLAGWIDADPHFERMAPVPFSTVCLRARGPVGASGEAVDRFNERLLGAVNALGPIYLSHTVLRGRYVLRLSVSNLRTEARHVEQAWHMLRDTAGALLAAASGRHQEPRGGPGEAA